MRGKVIEVIIVAKDRDTCELVKKTILTIAKAMVYSAKDAKEGVDLLDAHRNIDLLITDEFGHIHFNPVIQSWNRSSKSQKIPLILLATDISYEKLYEFRRYGIRHVLPKPLQPQELFEKLNTTLGIENKFSLEVIEKLRKTKFFQDFSLNELQAILAAGYIKRFQAEEVMIEEGVHIDKLGFILKGSVGIYLVPPEKPPILITQLTPYSLLGETTLLSRSGSSTRVVSQGDSILFMLPFFAVQLFSDEIRERLYRMIIRDLTKKLRIQAQEFYKSES